MRKHGNWSRRGLILALALCLGLSACGGPSPEISAAPGAAASPSPALQADGQLDVSLDVGATALDPTVVATVTEGSLVGHLFEGLMRWEPGERSLTDGVQTARVVPGMAERYEQERRQDGTVVYTFHLRPAKWSDGGAVTAHDFVYSWQRLMDPNNGATYAYLMTCVQGGAEVLSGWAQPSDLGVTAVDDATLQVTLAGDTPWFLELCAMPFTAPLRQDAVEAGEDGQWTYAPETFLTNGPYRLRSWEHNALVELERNPDYYETASGPEVIRVAVQSDLASAQADFAAGTLDFLQGEPGGEAEAAYLPSLTSYYAVFQTQKAPFDDARVRRAFALAIDRERVVTEQAPGQTPAGALVPYGAAGADGGDFRAAAGDYLDPSAGAYPGNCDTARELLAQAGYPGGSGFPEVEYLCPKGETNRAIGQLLAEMWQKELGVSVTVKEEEWGAFLERCHAGEFDLARGRWVGDYSDAAAFLDLWSADSAGNDAQYENQSFNDLLDQAADQPDARQELLTQAEAQLIGSDFALAPIYFGAQPCAVAPGVSGVAYSATGYFFFGKCQGA